MDYITRKEKCSICETVFEGSAEQPVDLELSLPDYCPDVERILKCRICPGISSGSITGDRLDVDGNVTIRLYYLDSKKQDITIIKLSENLKEIRGELDYLKESINNSN